MGKLKHGRVKGREHCLAVSVSDLHIALPLFWPVRSSIWDIPDTLGPIGITVLATLKSTGVPVENTAYSDAFLRLEEALAGIILSGIDRPVESFCRLWWLAEYLDGSAIDRVSDMLVTSKQTSAVWDAVLQAGAVVEAFKDTASIDRNRFAKAIDAAISE